MVMQLFFTYLPPFQLLFKTSPLDLQTWGLIIVIASSVLFLVELEKWVVRILRRRP
jgi:hypothetical protein